MKDVSFLKDGKTLAIGSHRYRKDGDNVILTRYDGHKSRVDVPYGVTEIGDESFAGTKINEVLLPPSLKTIGKKAFYGSAVRKIRLPSSVQTVYERAFDCSGLTALSIDNPNVFLYPEVFDHAYDLTEIVFAGTRDQWEEVFAEQVYSAPFVVRFSDGTTKQY